MPKARTPDASTGDNIYQNDEEWEKSLPKVTADQDTLIKSTNPAIIPRLKDVHIRSNIFSKNPIGEVEAHVNGMRFTSARGDVIDIIYSNIQNAFFQSSDREPMVLLHLTLKVRSELRVF